ncbi:MAG: LamG-like jellyroll fold domain-containing protein [Bacteroidales bacterium]
MKTKTTSTMNINAKSIFIFIVFLVLSINLQAQYCSATGGCVLYISRVQFSTIDNSSSCSNYSDYTSSFLPNLYQGYFYHITISNPNQYSSDSCEVWIDWNKDTLFDNNAECYRLSNGINSYIGTILVPFNASVGETRMRIRLRNGGVLDPCGNANQNYGEVEDYNVNVNAATQMSLGGIFFNQLNGMTLAGSQNVKIGCVKVFTGGSLNPLYLKEINLNTLGSSLNITDAQLYYTSNSAVFSTQTQLGSQITSPGSQLLFTDSITLLPDTNYFWLTYNISGSASTGSFLKANLESVNINDTLHYPASIDTSGYIEIVEPLIGTYTINNQGNGDYLSFNAAVNDLHIRGISGAVVFNVDSGTYNEQISISYIAGASSTNTITFRSTTYNYNNVILTHTPTDYSNNYTIKLQNTSFVYFQDITISAGYSYSYGKVISIVACNNISFIGNNIIGTQTYSGWDDNLALLYCSGYGSSNLSILNNNFQYGSYGIMFDTYSTMFDNVISGNSFTNQGGYGFYASNQSNLSISNNYFYSGLYSTSFYGIYCNYVYGNLLVNNNQIFADNFNSIYGIYIYDFSGDFQNSNISNNFISLNPSSNYAAGITLDYAGIGVYYNSINIYGNNSNTFALRFQNSTGLAIKNNILSNTANGSAIYSGSCYQCSSDYNDIYSNAHFATTSNDSVISDLISWNLATQLDSNSISVFPQFFSNADLHTVNIALNGKASPITGITSDIDNDTRNTTTPDIGADEFYLPPNDLKIDGFVNLPSGCGLSNSESIEVRIINVGDSNYIAGNASIKYSVDLSQQLANETININIASGDTAYYIFTAGANLSVDTLLQDSTFLIQSWIEYANDVNQSNDSISTTTLSRYMPPPPYVTDTIIPYATAVSLNALLPQDYLPIWYNSATDNIPLRIGNPLTTAVLYKPDTLYVSSKKGGYDYSIIGNEYNGSSFPFYSYYSDVRTQMIYTAQELQNAGFMPGNITSLGFDVYSQSYTTMYGFSINVQNTSLSNLNAYVETGWTNVYSDSYTVPGYGWNEIIFQNPFVWDGVSNLLINICYDNNSYGSNSNVYSSYFPGKVWTSTSSGGIGCSLTGGSSNSYRPNIRLKGTKMGYGCESNKSAVHIVLDNIPNKDIGITSILSPNSGFEISSAIMVGVVVKNFGATTLDTMYVSYQKTSSSIPVTEMITDSLASGDSLIYYFTQSVDITALGTYDFKAYTTVSGDNTYLNDTIHKTIQNFTYCTPSATYGCYYNINNFVINTLANLNSGCNSGNGSYIIYPENSFTTAFQKSISYPFTINTGSNYTSTGFAIWIDLNHDGDFDDAGEYLYNIYTSSNQISGSINIPSIYNYVGKTRLRLRSVRYNSLYSYNSCSSFTEYGEIEDYTISILSEPLQKDIKLLSILKPGNSTYQLIPSDVIVKIKNIGLDALTQIPFTYVFNNQSAVSYTWNGQVLPQQQMDINLPQLTPTTANNNFTVYAELSGDMDNTNDTLVKSFVALAAPALIDIHPDTIFGFIASCDSSSTQTIPFTIINNGYQPLNYIITQNNGISENFEFGLSKWIYNGNWGLISQGYNGGFGLTDSPGGNYGNGWNQYIQLKDSIYITNKDSCKIQYMLKRNTESGYDYLYTQISVNGGSWVSLSPSFSGTEDWTLKQFPYNTYVNNGDYIRFRFLFTTDGSVIADGVVIDNFSINGTNSSSWATLSKTKDTIATGDTSFINVNLKVGMLNAGNYTQNLTIISNDPLLPNLKLPVYLTITGSPVVMVKDSVFSYPSIMAGVVTSKAFKIYNTGCDSLKITAVNHSDASFTPIYPSFVMPKDSAIITVNFSSLTQGLHNDTLTVFNNSNTKHFYVSGTILPTPQLIVLPDSFLVNSSNCLDTISRNLQIKNMGNTTMNWNAYYSKGAEKSLAFNGSTSEVRFGNLGQIPQKGSVEFWMKSNVNSGTKMLYCSSGLNGNWKGINIYQSNSYLYLIVGNDNGGTYSSYTITSNIDYGKWHHVAVSWDITQNKVWTYFDGSVYSNGSYNPNWPTTTSSDVRIGIGYAASSGYNFNGEIDELRIWSENRTATDIKNLYKQANITPTSSLTGSWGFNETSGDTVYGFNPIKKGIMYNTTRVISGAKIENSGIDVYPTNGVLADGDSSMLQLTFVTSGLNSGSHNSGIGITSNDPLHSFVFVPTHILLAGSPQLSLLSNNLNMNSIMAGASITDSMAFVNTGCDTLKITNITHNNSVFTVNQSLFILSPKDTAKLKITFNPISIGNYFDTLQIISNSGIQQLFLHAVAVAAPIASVNPSTFNDTLTACNQSLTKYFKIRNTGNEILSWNGVIGLMGISDNFESGLSKWISSGGWGVINQGYNGGYALTESPGGSYGNSWSMYIQLKDSIFIANKDSCKIQYMLKRNMESCCDYLNTQISVNGGVWTTLSPSFNGTEDWGLKQFQFSSYVNTGDYIRFRFLFTSDGSVVGDGVLIDNFSINSLNTNNITPTSGTVAIGDSSIVQLIIDGQGLINGKYLSKVIINTNDPVHPLISIPVQLVIKANPLMTIAKNPVIMDTVMIGATSSKLMYIRNSGCDSLKITNITHSLSQFTISPLTLTILPKDSIAVNISFSALNVGNYIDTLKIFSNAGNKNIPVKAKALGAPEVITLPDQIIANISCDSFQTTAFKIKNPGIVPLNWAAFISNQEKASLQFDGINNYVGSGNWSPGVKWTIEAWVKPNVLSYGNKLIAGSMNYYNPWGICMVNSSFAAIYRSAQTGNLQTLIADNITVAVDNWYHVACAYNGSTIRLYINGQLVKTAIINSNYTAYSYPFIGGDPNNGNYFSGNIDEVRIWNKERSQSQIAYAMNHILVGNETGLVAYWPFNKVIANTVADFSGNMHTGTISGAGFSTNTSPVIGWANLSNSSGSINVGDSTQINVSINRHLLPQGSQVFKLIIQSDDPVKPFDTTMITVNSQFNLTPVDIGRDTNLCTGSISISSSGTYATYNWSNNIHNSSINVTSSGTYFLTVIDANGCKYSDTTQIGLTQPPVADAGIDKNVCQNNSVSLNGSASGGTPPYQYIWKNEIMNIVSNLANYSFTPANNLKHFLSVIDNNGCESSTLDTVNITVHPKPTVSAGNDTIINLGTSANLYGNVSGGTYPYSYLWSPADYLSSTNIINPHASPLTSKYYTLTATDANNCSASNNTYVKVNYILSGSVLYNNSVLTPIPNIWVYLENPSNGKIDSVLTSGSGTFIFTKVEYALYYLYAKPVASFGGINATDALGIRRHIVNLSTLSGLNYNAADVNKSNTISSADALQVLRRTIGLVSSFSSGDWVSERLISNYVSTNVQNLVIKVLCMGDVNGSYNIFSTKATGGSPEMECVAAAKSLIAGETFNLPFRLKQNIKPGAVTLHLQIPENLIEILGVSCNGHEIEYTIKNGVLSIGEYDEKGMLLNDNILLSLKCRVKPDISNGSIGISLSNENEIADIDGKVINGLQLEANCFKITEKSDEFKMEDNYPNPFSLSTTVRVYVPEEVSLRLSILNTLGIEIKSITTEKLTTGWHELLIDAAEFSQGAYMYRIQAIASKKTFEQTCRMMIIR